MNVLSKCLLSTGFSNLTHQMICDTEPSGKAPLAPLTVWKGTRIFKSPAGDTIITANQFLTKNQQVKASFPSREAFRAVLCSSVNEINSPDTLCWGATILFSDSHFSRWLSRLNRGCSCQKFHLGHLYDWPQAWQDGCVYLLDLAALWGNVLSSSVAKSVLLELDMSTYLQTND